MIFSIKTSIYKGFSMAMLNNQMVYTMIRYLERLYVDVYYKICSYVKIVASIL